MKTVGEPEEIRIPREEERPAVIPDLEPGPVPAEAPEREDEPVPA
jgi:hypothetical protein